MHPRYIIRKGFSHKNKKYLAWIRDRGCAVCKKTAVAHHVWCAKENDYLTIPLCDEHHVSGKFSYHKIGPDKFQELNGINFDWLIIELLIEYIKEKYA